MRVEILDAPSLKSVSPAALRSFALFEGWKSVDKFGTTSQIYVREAGGRSVEIILPAVEEIGDYATVVSQVIDVFARELGRDQLSIFRDLTHADRDVVRVRATESYDDGSIKIDPGVNLIGNARDMLASAACAATDPRRAYYIGKMQRASDYIERVRLGQTEIGSFVVTLLAPVPPTLDEGADQPALWPELEAEPYERRVTRMLSSALSAAKSAIADAHRGRGSSSFDEAVQSGVSANLCEAIAAMSDRGDGAEISVAWAKTRPTPIASSRVRFSVDDSDVLREVAREFRLKEPRPEVTLSGYFPALRRLESESNGTVKMIGLIDGRATSVSVVLNKNDYERALDAHGRHFGITVTGDLVREGQRWKLVRAHDISFVESANEGNDEPSA